MPIWDGSSSDPSAWGNYRYAIQGYCAGKGLSALLRIKYDNSVKSEGEETPDVYGAVIKDEGLNYAALIAIMKRMAALDSAMGRAVKTEELESQAFLIKTYRQSLPQRGKISWRPDRNQCLWCLKKGHRVVDCRSKANGEPSKIRPDGSRFEDHAKPTAKEQDAFAAQCFATQAQGKKGKKQQSWLVDSGCNKHMTPFIEDLRDVVSDNTQCRFGDSATARAEGKGNILLECSSGKEESVKMSIKRLMSCSSVGIVYTNWNKSVKMSIKQFLLLEQGRLHKPR